MVDETYSKMYRKGIFVIIALSIIFLIAFCIVVSPVDAATTVNSSLNITQITDTSITWNYKYLTANRPLGATLDGVVIEGWKADYVYNYTAEGLTPNTTHEFCIFGDASSNCERGTTTDEVNTSEEHVWSYLQWIILILISLVCIVVGYKFTKPVALIAVVIACYGIMYHLHNSMELGIVFGLLLIGGIWTALSNN